MEEIVWLPIEGFPNYLVSSTGKIKSLQYGRNKIEAELKLTIDNSGYYVCNISNGKSRKTVRVDYLVLEAFKPIQDPEIELEREPSHLDDDRSNNDIRNLVWETSIFKAIDPSDKRRRKGNLHHKFGVAVPEKTRLKMSLNHNKDKNHPNYKLTDKQVFEIKKRRYEGEDLETLALEYKQSIANISYITTGRRRKKIAVEYTMIYRVRTKK